MTNTVPSEEQARSPRVRGTAAERRVEIPQAALRVLGKYGWMGTTMSRVAAAVGLSGPALYRHFGSQSEIIDAAFQILADRLDEWLTSSDNPNALERLREIGLAQSKMLAADKEGFVAPMFQFFASGPHDNLNEARRHVVQVFAAIVREGQQQGTIRADADPEVVGWELVGLAWTTDLAVLTNGQSFIESGAVRKILDGILDRIAA